MSTRAAFFGYGPLGVAGLEALRAAGATIAAVVVPGNRAGEPIDLVRTAAARHDLPLLVQPARAGIRPFEDALRRAQPDVIVVWSYSMMLPPSVIDVPPHGAVNVHGGLLPEYRGGHVAQWAIISGAREFGVTLHYVDEGVDTGPVIAERRFSLNDTEHAWSLREKIRDAGVELLTLWWPRLADGTAPRVPQDPSRARYWRMRTVADGRIDWSMDADAICRLVRALACNAPGAYLEVAGRRISVRQAESARARAAVPPGQVISANASGVRVAAANGEVVIVAAEVEGEPVRAAALAELLSHSHE